MSAVEVVRPRVEPELKEQAAAVLAKMGTREAPGGPKPKPPCPDDSNHGFNPYLYPDPNNPGYQPTQPIIPISPWLLPD
jgi:hypothetical protein